MSAGKGLAIAVGLGVVGAVLLMSDDAEASEKPKPKPGGGVPTPGDEEEEETDSPFDNLSEEEWNRAQDALDKLENCGVGETWRDHYKGMFADDVDGQESGSTAVNNALDDLDYIAGKVCVLYDQGGTDTDPPPNSGLDFEEWGDLLADPNAFFGDLEITYNDLMKSKNPWQILELYRAIKKYNVGIGVPEEAQEYAKKVFLQTAQGVCNLKWTPQNDPIQYVNELTNLYQLAYNTDYKVFEGPATVLRDCSYKFAENRNKAIEKFNEDMNVLGEGF